MRMRRLVKRCLDYRCYSLFHSFWFFFFSFEIIFDCTCMLITLSFIFVSSYFVVTLLFWDFWQLTWNQICDFVVCTNLPFFWLLIPLTVESRGRKARGSKLVLVLKMYPCFFPPCGHLCNTSYFQLWLIFKWTKWGEGGEKKRVKISQNKIIVSPQSAVESWSTGFVFARTGLFTMNNRNGDLLSHRVVCDWLTAEKVDRGNWFPTASQSWRYTPSIAFWHLPPNSARFSYATEGALLISAQLSSDAVSALQSVPVLIWL